MPSNFIAKELVLLGGGHSHVIVLRMLAMQPIAGLQVTLISPDINTPYSGMLPGLVAGHYSAADMHIDLVPLCRFAGVRYLQASAYDIDPIQRIVRCEGRPDVGYDVLSIDIGITPAWLDRPSSNDQVIAVKPINQFLHKWQACLERLKTASTQDIGVVGGGAGGVELCLAIHHALEQQHVAGSIKQPINMHLFIDKDSVLPGYSGAVQRTFTEILRDRGIQLHTHFRVAAVEGKHLVPEVGEGVSMDEIFWVTSAAAQSWLAATPLATDAHGFVETRDTLQVQNYDDVFATGDIARVVKHPRPKAGVYAVRQGPVLFRNIRRLLLQEPLKAYVPQKTFLSLISTGDRGAVASKYGYSAKGSWVWRWKDWIDRRFMNQFTRLPAMQAPREGGLLASVDAQMQCGGCGSKVSADLLREVLAGLGLDTNTLDDAAVYQAPAGKLMLHSVDVFKAFIDDPFLLAKIAVNHALSDIYAMGGEAVTAMAIMSTPYGTPSSTRHLLQQLMQGTVEQLRQEQVQLVGGHTTEGAELSVGFAVNGIVDEAVILRKGGMRAGQVLILTKPLGTGTLFAADMQHLAQGNWVNAAVEMMLQSNQKARDIFVDNHVSACTDITGFGLAGHLGEMLQASGVDVTLDLAALPVLPGSLQCLHELGITSTLHDGNQRSAINMSSSQHPHYALLFDPQTAGGLLASVDVDRLPSILKALHTAGYLQAQLIGTVEALLPEARPHINFKQPRHP
ncbi:MAG: selenide,water dikinase [Candidatus Pseudothioglobus sp.]|jgi:selenide,water dikinase